MQTEDLKSYPDNPRIHGDGVGLSKSILKHGDLSGVVFNIRNQQLCGGHYRIKTIPKESIIESHPTTDKTGTVAEGTIILPTGQRLNYREVDWNEDQHREACILANNEKIQGSWDYELLNDQIEELSIDQEDFEDFHFEDFEIPEPKQSKQNKEVENDLEKIPLFLQIVELTPGQYDVWERVKTKLGASDDNGAAEILILKSIDTE